MEKYKKESEEHAKRRRMELAAPGLFEALEAIAQRANESGTGESGLLETIHAMHSMARAALRKARGEKA